jgi:hypothetical protein
VSPDVAASVKARLLADAKKRREEFERTLVRFAGERLLYRLGASDVRRRCLLKGASLLCVWLPDPYRATRDIDLLCSGLGDEGAARALLEKICSVPCPEDGMHFDLSTLSAEPIRADEEYVGVRARFLGYLGKARIRIQIDCGVGDALALAPEEIDYPTLLSGLPAPRLLAYPREVSVAEKLEAMVKLDTRNSRMKDFHDLWALSEAFDFDGPQLRAAISACFARREMPWTHEIPRPLTAGFYEAPQLAARWTSYLRSGAVLALPPRAFEAIGERIIRFFGPLRESIVAGTPFEMHWHAGGPWKPISAARARDDRDG